MTKLNSHTCDCIVIGGGAAGMMSAVCASQGGASVILIEHTARLGSKILQTGNGKCNFTNLHMQADCYQNGNPDFVMQVLNTFPVPLNFLKMQAFTTRTETDMSIPIRKRRLLCSPHCGMKSNRAV